MKSLNVLIACECSGVVRRAFRAFGHNAWSCDLLPAEDHSPYHIQCDALAILRGEMHGYATNAVTGQTERSPILWDLIIAHPPCTYLANSGVRWLYNADKSRNVERWENMRQGVQFFADLWNACGEIPRAFENPVMHWHAASRLCDAAPSIFANGKPQIVQPWMFGHMETKATGFYLHGLPRLVGTRNVYNEMIQLPRKERNRVHFATPGPNRSADRSRTLTGIAEAMAAQWSAHLVQYPSLP